MPQLPSCPVLRVGPTRGSALGWAVSAVAVAMGLSALAALAMAISPTGESLGAEPVTVLLPLQSPSVAAMSEAAPDVSTDAPDVPSSLGTPDTPPAPTPAEEVAPDRANPARTAPDAARDDALLHADTDPPPPPPAPAELAEMRAEPVPTVRPRPKPAARVQNRQSTQHRPAKPTAQPQPKPQQAEPPSRAAAAGHAGKTAPAAASAGQGAKAAADYGASVLKSIRKTKRKRAPARGVVIVSFRVSENGGLSSVAVARSSGSSGLDQIAVDHIRRSAPFGAPPAGARRSFSFEFVGKM